MCAEGPLASGCTFLSADPKPRILTKNSHIHHAKLHIWNQQKQSCAQLRVIKASLFYSNRQASIPLKNMAQPAG